MRKQSTCASCEALSNSSAPFSYRVMDCCFKRLDGGAGKGGPKAARLLPFDEDVVTTEEVEDEREEEEEDEEEEDGEKREGGRIMILTSSASSEGRMESEDCTGEEAERDGGGASWTLAR
jgi:hypothetical protein